MKKNSLKPDYAVAPGESIKECLECLDMTPADLAAKIDAAEKNIEEIIEGKAPITPEISTGLAQVFSPSAQFWLNLERQFQEDKDTVKRIGAISINEPWASMIARGRKTIEVRSWRTRHRGQILLCASAIPSSEISGKAFALAEIVKIRPLTPADVTHTGGYYGVGMWAWILENIQRIEPFRVSGKPGIFKVDLPKLMTVPKQGTFARKGVFA